MRTCLAVLLPGKHGFYSDMFWTPLIAQALAVERKKDSEMAGPPTVAVFRCQRMQHPSPFASAGLHTTVLPFAQKFDFQRGADRGPEQGHVLQCRSIIQNLLPSFWAIILPALTHHPKVDVA